MSAVTKLMTAGGGGVNIQPASSIASDVTVNVPSVNGDVVLTNVAGTVALAATGANIITASTNGTERMRINSSGNLLVGTTSGLYRVQTVGTSAYGGLRVDAPGSGSYWPVYFNDTDATSASQILVDIRRADTRVGYIATTNTTTNYASSSDYRLKENIQPMQNALATVAQLNPVTYTWKADGSDGQGFIAHELQAVVPDCVTGEKDAVDADGNPIYQGIDTSFLVATLTAAIQEQQAQIETLTAKVAALEAK